MWVTHNSYTTTQLIQLNSHGSLNSSTHTQVHNSCNSAHTTLHNCTSHTSQLTQILTSYNSTDTTHSNHSTHTTLHDSYWVQESRGACSHCSLNNSAHTYNTLVKKVISWNHLSPTSINGCTNHPILEEFVRFAQVFLSRDSSPNLTYAKCSLHRLLSCTL